MGFDTGLADLLDDTSTAYDDTGTTLDDTRTTLDDTGTTLDPEHPVDPGDADVSEVHDEAIPAAARARCADGRGTLTHLFFSDDEFDLARAKAICARCGLAPGCLAAALERGEPYGVWGGQLLIDGVIVAVKRKRGRPPKHPRPPLVVDEVPVPPHLVA